MSRKHGWHFAQTDFKLRYGDDRLIEPGSTFTVDCKPILCKQGLHDSIKAIDALDYGPGPVVSRTVLSGEVIEGYDKRVGTKRIHLWCYDATEELNAFARWCALEVIDLWDAPAIVREYLETGNENLRVVARDTAYNAASAAAWAAKVADADANNAVWYAANNTNYAAASAVRAASNATRDAWVAASNARKCAKVASVDEWHEIFDKQNKKLEQMLKDGWKKRNQ